MSVTDETEELEVAIPTQEEGAEPQEGSGDDEETEDEEEEEEE